MRILSLTYLTGIILISFNCSCARNLEPAAVKGVLDLREYNLKTYGPVDLKGEFEFYWNQLLDPTLEGDSGVVWFIQVPGSWYNLRKEDPEITRHGFATYRLTILLPKGVDELSFSIDGVYSASVYFLNGKALDYLGFPGVTKFQTVLKYKKPLVTGRVSGDKAELLIQVSNFDFRISGIAGRLRMGLPAQMQMVREKQLFHAHFLIGAFVIIGIFFLGLFLIRTEEYRLYLSILCLLMALRVAIISEIPFLDAFNMSGLTSTRLDFLNVYLFLPFFTLMIRSIFPIEFPQIIFRIIMWLAVLFIVMVIITPISLFSFSMIPYFVLCLAGGIVYLYVVILALIRGRSYAPAFMLGLVILLLGGLNDFLVEMKAINSVPLGQYALFLFLMVYSYIFADKANHLQKKSDQLSEELSQVRNNLEELVEERTTELQSVSHQLEQQKKKLEVSNRELVDAMNARNRMFSIIGHDVRAPIGYLKQALEMMLASKRLKVKEREEMLSMMAGTAEVTYNLLDNLLVWGRSQTGRLKSNPVEFQLKALIDESLELVHIALVEKKLKVEVYISEDHYIHADRDQLYIVVRNLLSNAMKFTPEKGSIYISSKMQKGDIVVSVRDTGIGIPEAMRKKILDARSHISTNGTKGEKGSGLGLKICKEIIQINRGWIDVVSAAGSGTTILVGVPSADKPVS
jgi:signal transduction histidine kinase